MQERIKDGGNGIIRGTGPIAANNFPLKIKTRLKNQHVAATWRSRLSYIIMEPVISGESIEEYGLDTERRGKHIRE